MKNIIIAVVLLSSSFCLSQEWKLVWSDEFEYEGLPDSTKWNYEVGYIRNSEKQYYTEKRYENARVEDGNLVIEARKEDYKDMKYTSASIHTKNTASWTNGRIEVKAKLPTGKGTWPAIWMLGTNISDVGWPECGELDIMENVGYDPNHIHFNIHTEAYNHVKGTNKGATITANKPYENFYVYAIEWFEDRIDFYFNDTKTFTFKNEEKTWKEWPYFEPEYFIINLAIGGSWGGQQGIEDSIFPQKYYIDYVRVYKDTSVTTEIEKK